MNTLVFDHTAHLGWVLVWVVGSGLLVFLTWRRGRPVVGLALTYVANLSLIHWISAASYALPWQRFGSSAIVSNGFRISTIGLLAFVFGWWIVSRRPAIKNPDGKRQQSPATQSGNQGLARLPRLYLFVGGALWLVYLVVGVSLPSIGAIVSAGQSLLIAGLCLAAWLAWRGGTRRRVWGILAIALLFPLVTTVMQGFLGYGVASLLVILCFVAAFYRPRWQLIAVGIIAFYGGLSLYHSYMSARTHLREVVWGGDSYEARFAVVGEMMAELKPLDFHDAEMLRQIDARLNQNYLVGVAAAYLDWPNDYAMGETIWMAAMALVPRIVWPGKPVEAGSMGLVSVYTGIQFAEGTSVGMGHPFELFINFGTWGVFVGLVLLGMATALVDKRAAMHLIAGRWDGFALWFVPGLALLNVGGSFVGLTASAAASVVLVIVVNTFALGRRPKRDPHPFANNAN